MTVKEVAFKVEDVSMKLNVLNSTTLAIHDAIVEGPNDTSCFYDALHGLTCMVYEIDEELSILVDELFKSVKQ